MPCKCSGFKTDKCKCMVLGSGYHYDSDGGVTLVAPNKCVRPHSEFKQPSKIRSNFVFRIIEYFYEKCAAYNLRYCPIRGYTKHDSYLSNTLKDVVILICFLVANFIVFLAIFTKMMVHMYFAVLVSAQWLGRHVMARAVADTAKTPTFRKSCLSEMYIIDPEVSLASKADPNESPVALRPTVRGQNFS